MTTKETIDLSLPVVNWERASAGVGERLVWGFDLDGAPEDLTGQTVTLVLWPGRAAQKEIPLEVDGPKGEAAYEVPASLPEQAPYVVLVSGEARVTGTISRGVVVRP